MRHSEGSLPIRVDGSGNQKKQANSRTRSQKSQQTHHQTSPCNTNSLQFINLLGTEKHDTLGRNTVRSHARRHAWKSQKEKQGKTSQQRLLKRNEEDQVPLSCGDKCSRVNFAKSLNADAQSYYNQCSKIREIACLLPQRSTEAAQLYMSQARTWIDENIGHTNLPPDLGSCPEAAIVAASHPSLNRLRLTNGHADPFDAFPIPLTPRLHHIFQSAGCISTVFNEDPCDSYQYHMCNSPALVFATLAWTAGLTANDTLHNDIERDEYYLHRSVEAINYELSNLHRFGLTDSTIAAVACLSNLENLNGDKEKSRIHMNGLKQMVAMRGGMSRLGMNGALRRLVLWADVFTATRWQTTPIFPLVELPDLLDLAPLCYFRSPATPKPHFIIKNDILVHDAEATHSGHLLALMKSVYELAHFLDNAPPKDPSILDRASFPDRIYIIEHKILSLIVHNETVSQRSSVVLPLLHSLLLYIYTNIRLTPVDGKIRHILISRLQDNIKRSEFESLNRHSPHELRWILFLGGGAASAGTPERGFFVEQLLRCECRREWGSWENILLLLKGMETTFLTRCQEFWNEVVEVREKRCVTTPRSRRVVRACQAMNVLISLDEKG